MMKLAIPSTDRRRILAQGDATTAPYCWLRDDSRPELFTRDQVSSSHKTCSRKNNLQDSLNLRYSLARRSIEQRSTLRVSHGVYKIIGAVQLAMCRAAESPSRSIRANREHHEIEFVPTMREHLTVAYAVQKSFLPGSTSSGCELERATGSACCNDSPTARREPIQNSCQPILPGTKRVRDSRKLSLFAGGELLCNLPHSIARIKLRAQARLHSRSVWEAVGRRPIRLARRLIV